VRNRAFVEGPNVPRTLSNIVTVTALARPKTGWIPLSKGAKAGEPLRVYVKDETTTGITIRIDIPGIHVQEVHRDGRTIQSVTLPGRVSHSGKGKPRLPVVREILEIPSGVSVSTEILEQETAVLKGYILPPDQVLQSPDAPPVSPPVIDAKTYHTDALYSEAVAAAERKSTGILRGHRILFLALSPVRYNPVTGIIEVSTMLEVRVTYDQAGQVTGVPLRLRSKVFDELLEALILNYKDPQRLSPGSEPGGGGPGGGGGADGCNYLIITHDGFYNENDPTNPVRRFADWKRSKGYSTRVVKVGTIGNDPQAIRNFVWNAYTTWNPAPEYLLLIGDSVLVRPYPGGEYEKQGPAANTDMYYAAIDGADWLPDICVGRLSVDSLIQTDGVINKILEYEQNPPDISDHADFYRHASVVAEFSDIAGQPYPADGVEGAPAEEYQHPTAFVTVTESIRRFLKNQNYAVEPIYATDSGYPGDPAAPAPAYFSDGVTPLPSDLTDGTFNWNGGVKEISRAFDDGRFMILYLGHGLYNAWDNPKFNARSYLGETRLTPVVFSMSCQTGWFDSEIGDPQNDPGIECFAEELLRKPQAGAVAITAFSRNSICASYITLGLFKAMWPEFNPDPKWAANEPQVPARTTTKLLRMGQIFNFSKLFAGWMWGIAEEQILKDWETLHLFGDPEMSVWTAVPGELTVSHPTSITFLAGPQDFVVNVSDAASGTPVLGAMVAFTQDSAIIERKQTNTYGFAQFRFPVNIRSGGMDITVTAPGFRPYLGTMNVGANTAQINRLEPAAGKPDQLVHIGGTGFASNEPVDLEFDGVLITPAGLISDTTGAFGQGQWTVDIRVPHDKPSGQFNIIAKGRTSGNYGVRAFQVYHDTVDLWTYNPNDASTWWINFGDNPTWDSPDIQLFGDRIGMYGVPLGYGPVGSGNLVAGKTYAVKVTVRNKLPSLVKDANDVFYWMNYGAYGDNAPLNLFGSQTISVPAYPPGEATASAEFSPPATGHFCLVIKIDHKDETSLSDNTGQENLTVSYTQSPAEVCLDVINPTEHPAPVHLEVRQLITPGRLEEEKLWESWIRHPKPQVLQPGETARACLIVDPKHAEVPAGTPAEFAVTAFVGRKMVGGVNLRVIKQ
jgi:hypothetical protein